MNERLGVENERKRSVLIVDDEPGMRYASRRILQARYEVTEAGSGEEAIDLFAERQFHVAVVDVRLPGLTGLELLATIKVMSPSTDVVIMTGSAKDPDEALLRSIRSKAFFFLRKPFSAAVLETLVDRITETQLLEERVQQHARRLEEDLESARIFQQELLPPADWTTHGIEVAGLYVPSRKMSGDLLDYWSLPGGEIALLVADVMGHGAPAAMLTGIVKSQVRSLAAGRSDPSKILEGVDHVLGGLSIRKFLTAMLVIVDPARAEVRWSGAGHPPGTLRLADGTLHSIESRDLPLNLGLPDPIHRECGVVEAPAGARILLWTDGVTEALAPDGTPFNENPRSAEWVREAMTLPPKKARTKIESALRTHTKGIVQEDDRAFLLAELKSTDGPTREARR